MLKQSDIEKYSRMYKEIAKCELKRITTIKHSTHYFTLLLFSISFISNCEMLNLRACLQQ